MKTKLVKTNGKSVAPKNKKLIWHNSAGLIASKKFIAIQYFS
jgi:hypothetical protein